MRKLVVFMHTSLDGFVAGTNGEMDWINISEEMFELASKNTKKADIALYGRTTFELMENYWPTASEKTSATRHDKEHSKWYNKVNKIVLSRSFKTDKKNITVVGYDLKDQISVIKQLPGKNIIVFGSPSAVHSLMHEDLVDDYWLFINPVLLGNGIPLFKDIDKITKLSLKRTITFPDGVVCLHYKKVK